MDAVITHNEETPIKLETDLQAVAETKNESAHKEEVKQDVKDPVKVEILITEDSPPKAETKNEEDKKLEKIRNLKMWKSNTEEKLAEQPTQQNQDPKTDTKTKEEKKSENDTKTVM